MELNIYLPYDPAIPPLGIYLTEMKTYIHMKTCTEMFKTTFIITKNEKQIKCLSTRERQINCGIFVQWNSTQQKKE